METSQDIRVSGRAAAYFSRAWWMALLEGIVAIGAGLFLLFQPVNTIVFVVQVLGIYWLVSGIFHSVASLFGSKENSWWTRLVGGILLALIGVAVLSYPLFSAAVTASVLVMFLASLAVLGGIMAMIWGFSLSEIPGEGWTVMSGLLSVVLGLALFTAPVIAVRGLEILVGLFAFAGGIGQVIFSFRLRSMGRRLSAVSRIGRREYLSR